MAELVLEITPDGRARAMHSDKFDLGFLGDKSIRRQTEILFNEKAQCWDIVYLDESGDKYEDEALQGFAGYEEARQFEVDWINRCRLYQLDPKHYLGVAYARYLRVGDQHECFTLPNGDCIADQCIHVQYPE